MSEEKERWGIQSNACVEAAGMLVLPSLCCCCSVIFFGLLLFMLPSLCCCSVFVTLLLLFCFDWTELIFVERVVVRA